MIPSTLIVAAITSIYFAYEIGKIIGYKQGHKDGSIPK